MTEEEFIKTYCRCCGSQRCTGPGDEMAKGCSYYRQKILNHDYFTKAQAQLPNYTKFIEEALKKYMEARFHESNPNC